MEPNELFLGGALLLNKSYSSAQRDKENRHSLFRMSFGVVQRCFGVFLGGLECFHTPASVNQK